MEFYLSKIVNFFTNPLYILFLIILIQLFIIFFVESKKLVIFFRFVKSNKKTKTNKKKDNMYKGSSKILATFAM